MRLIVLSNEAYRQLSTDAPIAILTCDAYLDAITVATGVSQDELAECLTDVDVNTMDLGDADLWIYFLRTGSRALARRIASVTQTDVSTIFEACHRATDVIWPSPETTEIR